MKCRWSMLRESDIMIHNSEIQYRWNKKDASPCSTHTFDELTDESLERVKKIQSEYCNNEEIHVDYIP